MSVGLSVCLSVSVCLPAACIYLSIYLLLYKRFQCQFSHFLFILLVINLFIYLEVKYYLLQINKQWVWAKSSYNLSYSPPTTTYLQ